MENTIKLKEKNGGEIDSLLIEKDGKYIFGAFIRSEVRMAFNEMKEVNPELFNVNFKDIKLIGSYGTKKYRQGKSDIDFIVLTDKPLSKDADVNSIIDFINSHLMEKYGEIEGKGGFIEVLGVNDKTNLK